jgi:hypothetical protein
MSGSDLIVEAPWIIFGAAVLAICIRLLRSRPARRQPEPAPLPSSDPDGSSEAAPGQCAARAVIVPAAPRRRHTNQAGMRPPPPDRSRGAAVPRSR